MIREKMQPKLLARWGFALGLALLVVVNVLFYIERQRFIALGWISLILLSTMVLSLILLGLGYLVLNREIADRRRAERFLNSIIDNIPHLVTVKDAETLRFTLMNKSAEDVLGLHRGEAIGKLGQELPTPLLNAQTSDEIVLDSGQPLDIASDNVLTRQAGWRTLYTKKVPIIDEGGLPLYLLQISEDITERRQTDRQLAAQYAIARHLTSAESLPAAAPQILQAVCDYLDWDLAILWQMDQGQDRLRCMDLWQSPGTAPSSFAERCREMTHALGQGLVGTAWASRKPVWAVSAAHAVACHRIDSLREAGFASGLACPIILDQDVLGVLELYAERPREPSEAFLNMIRTIASQLGQFVERKKAEQQLKEARDTALESARFKSEFMANMSHEIRTPMNAIIGMTDLLMTTEMTGRQKEFVEVVHRSGEALLQIINDILDFSKIEAGKFVLENIAFDVQEPIEQVCRMLASRAQTKGVELMMNVHPDVPRALTGDPSRLSQVITNLVGNAVKFTSEGEVLVDVQKRKETETMVEICFRIQDTGVGIPLDAQKHLFQAFTQADGSTTRRFGGTGLGLAISRRLVDLMGGEIHFISQEGEGSTFTVKVPFHKVHADNARVTTPSPKVAGRRVLIVDGNETHRNILHLQMQAWGLLIDEAASAADARQRLRQARSEGKPFAIAVIDQQLADPSGLDLAAEISRDPAAPSTHPLLLCDLGKMPSHEALNAAGVTECLTKPVRRSELLEAINREADETLDRPVRSEPDDIGVARAVTASMGEGSPLPPSEARLLLAEDNAVNRSVARFQLAQLGYDVTIVENGREVIDILNHQDFDLILMDCQMPLMDGFQASVEIRWQEGSTRHIPIIAMTANALEGDRERCLQAGMDDYLSKPVRRQELQDVLRRWLPRANAEPAAVIDVKRLHELTDQDEKALRQLVGIYFRETALELERLAHALQNQDAAEIARMAHGCAGASASYGMNGMVEPLRRLESAAKANDWKQMTAEMGTLRHAFEAVRHQTNIHLHDAA